MTWLFAGMVVASVIFHELARAKLREASRLNGEAKAVWNEINRVTVEAKEKLKELEVFSADAKSDIRKMQEALNVFGVQCLFCGVYTWGKSREDSQKKHAGHTCARA